MNQRALAVNAQASAPVAQALEPTSLALTISSRVANIVLTAQVQASYACASAARARAQYTLSCIERSWPQTPVRALVLHIYRAQMQSADLLARGVLEAARRRCGLAFARCC